MWFCTLLARSSGTRARRSRLAPASRSDRPLLEVLEDRTLLSTYVVDSLTDTGTGSGLAGDLRYCITNATSGSDTIAFAQGLTGAIALESALPNLNASVSIEGPGADKLTIIPEYSIQFLQYADIFSVGSAATVQISGLTLSDVYGSDHGTDASAIGNAGTLTVNACTIDDIYNQLVQNNGTLTLSDCTVSDNADVGNLIENFVGSAALTVSQCTLSGNYTYWFPLIYNNAGTVTVSYSTFSGNSGACIVNFSGSATVSYSTFSENTENLFHDYPFSGGAIFNLNSRMTINNSTITDNRTIGASAHTSVSAADFPASSCPGGGIWTGGGTLSINSSTITGNEAIGGSTAGLGGTVGPAANGLGGGLYIAAGTVSINNSTLADNQAIGGAATLPGMAGAGYGGGIYNAAGPGALQMYDTILADNGAATADADLDGSVTSLGHNLIGSSTGGSGFAVSDLLNVDPQLGPLQNNGGPTQTMALLAGSPAINHGNNANAPAYDQRGPSFPRIVGGKIDIGAFEVQPTRLSFLINGFPASISAGSAGTVTVTAMNADGSTDTSYTGTVHFTNSDKQAVLPGDYAFTSADAGVHTFTATLKTAGVQSITATDTVNRSVIGTESGIVVNPAAAASFVVTGFPSPTTAGISGAFTITGFDAYGNKATGYTGTVHITSTDTQAVLPGNYTFTVADHGRHAFHATLKTAGTQSLTATDTTTVTLTGSQSQIQVNPAAATHFVVTAPGSVTAGVAFQFTVTAEDRFGNVATGYTGTAHFTSTDRKAVLPADYAFQAGDNGIHTFSATLKTAGTMTLRATDTTNSKLTGADKDIVVINPAGVDPLAMPTAALARYAGADQDIVIGSQTLEATDLVHEAYLRLVDVEKAQYWNSRGHFFMAAAI
jgi:hypothetical protein